MLKVKHFVSNNFEENTYLLIDNDTLEAAVVDPGMLSGEERAMFDSYIRDNDIRLEQIILTHGHLDHCFGANYVRNRYGAPVKAHASDAPLLAAMRSQGLRFGMGKAVDANIDIDVPLADGDTILIGKSTIEVLHVPGHSPGGIALYAPNDGFVIVGDSLFRNSIGRTDLEGGDMPTLVNAIHSKLMPLPARTIVLPGHGPFTTIGAEKSTNPYLTTY